MTASDTAFTECINPATGQSIGRSALHTVADLQASIQTAQKAQPGWAVLPVAERIGCIRRVRDYIVDNADEIAETISADNGKVRVDALATEILPAAMAASYYMRQAHRFLRARPIRPGNFFLLNKRSQLRRVPYGVVGIISPWNYPFAIPFSEVIMALLAGNAVILKTASQTQRAGRILEQSILAAGLPKGIFQYINLPGRLAGDGFLENGIDKLFFTGSTQTGKYLMRKAAETLTPLVLELGGNDAMLVCEDASLQRTVAGAIWGAFSNAGQSCAAIERIYVHEAIYDTFLEMLKAGVEGLRIGIDQDFEVDIGAMTTAKQTATVQEQLNDALQKGATIFAQSAAPEGANFLPAIVLTDTTPQMKVMQEETFGPLVAVTKVCNMKEAIRLANDSQYGLSASVWSRNRRNAKAIARQLRAGAVMINDHLMSHGLAETPWGGFKQSGIGRTHGRIGFDEMTQPQVIVDDCMPFVQKDLWWHPYSGKLYTGLRAILILLYGKGVKVRWKALGTILSRLPRMFSSKS